MDFKIDTKDSHTIIVPAKSDINAILAGAITEKCQEMRQSGSKNFIIDLSNCEKMDRNAIDELIALHEECYGAEESLVYTGLNKEALNILKENEIDLVINIAPTLQEAIDIISMEILERDLFSEE